MLLSACVEGAGRVDSVCGVNVSCFVVVAVVVVFLMCVCRFLCAILLQRVFVGGFVCLYVCLFPFFLCVCVC